MRVQFFKVVILALLAIAGCSAPKPIVLTGADDGRSVQVTPGTELLVSLEANPTTGYLWTQTKVLPGMLVALGGPSFVANRASPATVGGSGIVTWKFRAAAVGEQRLQFEYHRPFEKEMTPARTVTIDIRVRKAGS